MRILKGILIVMILVPISCSKKGDYPVETEFIDGVQVVINPDYPRDGRYLIALEEELSIGESEEEGQYFSQPDAICVSDDGTI